MKRIITIVLAFMLCLSLACPAFAAVDFVSDITTKSAPELVAVDEENVGVFFDGEENEIGKLKEDGIIITALSEAETSNELPEEAKADLLEAYEKLSNPDALLSVQAPAMNDVAVELLGEGHTADAFVVHDLFDATLLNEEDINTLTQEANVLKLTFADAHNIIAAMAYVDGVWIKVDVEHNEDGSITCTFKALCPVAFLIPTGGAANENAQTDSTSETRLPEFPLDTSNFVPSISGKTAPKLVTDMDGEYGSVITSDGNVTDVISAECLVVTPVAEAETSRAIPEEAAKELLMVYEKLSQPETKLSEEAPAMNEVAEKLLSEGETADDFVIRDLFDVSFICEEHRECLKPEGVTLKLIFDLGIDPSAIITAMVYIDGEWVPVETVNNGNDTVTCVFEDTCPVAFLVPNEERSSASAGGEDGGVDDSAVNNTKSENIHEESETSNTTVWAVVGVAALIAIFVTVFFLNRSKKKANA